MARRRQGVSIKPVIKSIQASQKAVRAIRKHAEVAERPQIDLQLENLRALEHIAKAMCRAEFLPIFTEKR